MSNREAIHAEAEKLARAIHAKKETAAKATAEILRPMLVSEWRALNLDVDAGEWFRSVIRETTSGTARRRADAIALLHHVITFIGDYSGVNAEGLAGWFAAVRRWEDLAPEFMQARKGGPLTLARVRQAGDALIQERGRPPEFTDEFCIAIHTAIDEGEADYDTLIRERADCAGISKVKLYEARRRGEKLARAAASQKRRQ